MGTDIYAESGVLATLDEMRMFITGKNKKRVIEICQSFYDGLKKEAEENSDDEWRKGLIKAFESLNNIKAKTLDDLRDVVVSVVKVSGEPAKYDLDTCVENSEYIQSLFSEIVEAYSDAHNKDVPYLQEVNAWGSARYNGWSVPLGEACFIFDKDSCFTQQISEDGKNLKKVIGHCNVTEWTEYSC